MTYNGDFYFILFIKKKFLLAGMGFHTKWIVVWFNQKSMPMCVWFPIFLLYLVQGALKPVSRMPAREPIIRSAKRTAKVRDFKYINLFRSILWVYSLNNNNKNYSLCSSTGHCSGHNCSCSAIGFGIGSSHSKLEEEMVLLEWVFCYPEATLKQSVCQIFCLKGQCVELSEWHLAQLTAVMEHNVCMVVFLFVCFNKCVNSFTNVFYDLMMWFSSW